jgi:hypothetical protein
LTLTAPPGDATPFGVFGSHAVPQDAVEHVAILPGGERVVVPPPEQTAPADQQGPPTSATTGTGAPYRSGGATRRAPLGTVVGARSGDKGGDANLGVWARDDAGWAWLRGFLTTERLRELLPETAPLTVERYELPKLRAVNFLVRGILGEGVAASTRFDPQGKALGEWLRSRVVEIPEGLG